MVNGSVGMARTTAKNDREAARAHSVRLTRSIDWSVLVIDLFLRTEETTGGRPTHRSAAIAHCPHSQLAPRAIVAPLLSSCTVLSLDAATHRRVAPHRLNHRFLYLSLSLTHFLSRVFIS